MSGERTCRTWISRKAGARDRLPESAELSGRAERQVNMRTHTRRVAVVLAAVGLLAACDTSDADSTTSSGRDLNAASAESIQSPDSMSSRGETSMSPTTETSIPDDSSTNMSVGGALLVGAEFDVSFTGSLRDSRGGYFWLQHLDGTRLALLRSDGNSEIPMGYDLNVVDAMMLADGLSGERSTLVLPPQLLPGPYRLCTANSATDHCIDVDVDAT